MSRDTVGSFALVLHSHIPYVLAHGRWPHGTDWLSEAAADCYLPLLDVFGRLVAEGVSPKVTLGLTPILVEQLADPAFADELEGYLTARAHAAVQDLQRFRAEGRADLAALASHWQAHYQSLLDRYLALDRDLVGAFRSLQDAGHIEILASAATHAYLPLAGTDASVAAQVRQGVASYRRHFGRSPVGFWLPECAYRPRYRWRAPTGLEQDVEPVERRGIEEFLADNGLAYTFVDDHLLQGGRGIGVYADRFAGLQELWSQFEREWQPVDAERTTFQPYVANSTGAPLPSVAVFARNRETGIQVWSGDAGYPGDEWYLEFHKKHYPSQLRYWRVSWPRDDLGSKALYEPVRAQGRLSEHARHFAEVVRAELAAYREKTKVSGVLPALYDTELFGHWWFEGAEWLYYALRQLDADPAIRRVMCGEYLRDHPAHSVVALPEGSWGEGGYHWVWLNEWTAWTWQKVYECEAEMTRLADAYADDPRVTAALKQTARELLLLESSDWQFNITTWAARDYAEARVNDHYARFQSLAALVRAIAGNEDIPPDAVNELAEIEACDRCFPDIDPSWWLSGSQGAGAERDTERDLVDPSSH